MKSLIRQYNLAWEIEHYLENHPKAAVVELGVGLSCLRRQMENHTNPWYCLDLENVITLRNRHIPLGEQVKNIACDLNDLSWFDRIDFQPAEGIVFTAGGLFYYFQTE
jgi:O-methyltransferase involved in polyketide biosynthesis